MILVKGLHHLFINTTIINMKNKILVKTCYSIFIDILNLFKSSYQFIISASYYAAILNINLNINFRKKSL